MEKQNLLDRSILAYLVSFLSLVLFLFLLNIFIRQYSDKSLWDISLAVFTLLGILLTAGAAFATMAAVISYFSVNEKLKKAEGDLKILEKKLKESEENLNNSENNLKQANNNFGKLEKNLKESEDALARFKELDDERKKLEDANNQLKAYKTAVQSLENKEVVEHSDLQQYIELVLNSENAIFQDRIRANAIRSDLEAEEKIDREKYKEAVGLSEYAMACWKLLFLYNPEQNAPNYANAMFNLAYSQNLLGCKDYQYIVKLYQNIIELSEKYDLYEEDLFYSYHNLAGTLLAEANTIEKENNQKANKLRNEAKKLINDFIGKYRKFSAKLAYNLACIAAQDGNIQEAIKQLKISQEANNFPSKEHIETDIDLDGIRNTPEFQEWFNKAFPN